MDAATLAEVMGHQPGVDYAGLLPHYESGMRAAQVTTPARAAMWAAQIGHESEGLRWMNEIWGPTAAQRTYDGRMGNRPGTTDWSDFRGRGPIQLTGRNNYTAFTRWANGAGHTDIDFTVEPQRVAEPRWGFLAAAWYWTQARPQINSLSDAGDLDAVTRAINGGLNGIHDRRARYDRALGMASRLLPGGIMPPQIFHPMRDEDYTVSSGYGPRWGTHHNGQDYAADHGTPIYAVTDGLVIQGSDRAAGSVDGFGNWVWIDSQAEVGKDFIYGHMPHASILVSRGQRVTAGQKIAEVGSEGQSTGPHLHFEVWGPPGRTGGQHEDPAAWLDAHVNNGNTKEGDTPVSNDNDIRSLLAIARSNAARLTQLENQLLGLPQEDRPEAERNPNGGRGWPQLGSNAAGQWLSLIDGASAGRHDNAAIMRLLAEMRSQMNEIQAQMPKKRR